MVRNELARVTVWLLLGLVAWFSDPLGITTQATALMLLSSIGVVFSTVSFWRHGGARITAPGIYALGTAMFCYFPGFYLVATGRADLTLPLLTATGSVYIAHVLSHHLFWRKSAVEEPADRASAEGTSSAGWLVLLGVVLMAIGNYVEHTWELGAASLAGATAFVGATVVAYGALAAGKRLTPIALVIAAAALITYAATMFSGGGRLVLGALGLGFALMLNRRAERPWVKVGLLGILPVGLLALVQYRADLVAATRGGRETGFESVTAPLTTFARILQLGEAGQLDFAFGKTLWAALVVPVPRALWPEKPVGLGAELTGILRPELLPVGQSEAILLVGEFYYNLGWAGVVLLGVAVAIAIRKLDALLFRVETQSGRGRSATIKHIIVVVATAGLVDLVWAGMSTYAARAGLRIIVLVLLLLILPDGITKAKRPQAWRRRRAVGLGSAALVPHLTRELGSSGFEFIGSSAYPSVQVHIRRALAAARSLRLLNARPAGQAGVGRAEFGTMT